MILNQNNQIRNYYIFHHELPNRFHCCSSPESTRRNCPAGHYAVVLRDSHTVVSIISPTWLISPRRQRGPQLWERCVVRWQFTVTAEIKRQLFISRELFSPGVLLIIIFLSGDFYLRRRGQIFILWCCTCKTGIFKKSIHIREKVSESWNALVSYCTFVSKVLQRGQNQTQRACRKHALNPHEPVKPRFSTDTVQQQIREVFWIRLRSPPSNQP